MTYKYCKIQKIPFPKVEISKEEEMNPKECYVFSDAEDPRAPIVIHFPLVNDTFKEFKEPGKFSQQNYLVEFRPFVFPEHGSQLPFVAVILSEGTAFM